MMTFSVLIRTDPLSHSSYNFSYRSSTKEDKQVSAGKLIAQGTGDKGRKREAPSQVSAIVERLGTALCWVRAGLAYDVCSESRDAESCQRCGCESRFEGKRLARSGEQMYVEIVGDVSIVS